jgi:nitroreductase
MEVLEAIRTRRSIRKFQNRPVPGELVRQMLEAAMFAPSARNAQPWQFVVIEDRQMLVSYGRKHPNAEMAAQAPLGILVCGDKELELSPGYWPVDCAAAVQNLLLAAHALGLGAVWTGVYPREDRMATLRQMCQLPEPVMPHSLILIGYPAESPTTPERFKPERVHRDRFGQPYAF